MAWRVARSLNTLLDQLNAMAPNRSKASDGAIGDPSHSSRTSDHNPDPGGVVRARDFTHDPAGGLDCHRLAAMLVQYRDARLKYVIWNKMIYSSPRGAGWAWRRYSGTNPHTHHLHLSVVTDGRADELRAWTLSAPAPAPTEEDEDEMSNVILVHGDSTQQVPGKNYDWGDLVFMVAFSPQYPDGWARRYMANGPAFTRAVQKLGSPIQWPQAQVDAIPFVAGGEPPAAVVS